MRQRVLVFIVAYEAQAHIDTVLARIPEPFWDTQQAEVLLIDDASPDTTARRAAAWAKAQGRALTVKRNPRNLGYGGNQKLGYRHAIDGGFDAVVLLHGDGQYAPEYLGDMVQPILSGEAEVVLGSRMIRRGEALKGGMPLYKFCGNVALTWFQNRVLGTKLAEFHTGYRAYSVPALGTLPLDCNPDGFAFDTDILIQCIDSGFRIREIAIPTFYGDEISHVNCVPYGLQIACSTVVSRLQKHGLYYTARFDYGGEEHYPGKLGIDSSHRFALRQVTPGSRVVDIGGGNHAMTRALQEQGCVTCVIDRKIGGGAQADKSLLLDVELAESFAAFSLREADAVLLLDTLEHLHDPEMFMIRLRGAMRGGEARLILTVPNVAYWTVRFSLLTGRFSYTSRGLLDRTHARLFTRRSLCRLLAERGFIVESCEGIPPPYALVAGERVGAVLARMSRLLMRLSIGLFAWQIGVVARPRPDARELLAQAQPCSV